MPSRPVGLLQDLLQIASVNPPGNEGAVAEALEAPLRAAGAEVALHSTPGGRVNLVARLRGRSDRRALLLVSHTDVVDVEPNHWTRDPFGGEIAGGFVWGRGALDMKSISVMHVEAMLEVARRPDRDRDLILVAVADEEAGSDDGMEWLLREHPGELGFDDDRPLPWAIGEGGYGLSGVIDRPVMPIVRGEKKTVRIELHAEGDPGHGSVPPSNQAIRNLVRVIERVTAARRAHVHPVMREQFSVLASYGGKRAPLFRALASGAGGIVARTLRSQLRAAGAVGALLADTVTPTRLEAGLGHNVVPATAAATLDCRLLPDADPHAFVAAIARESGNVGAHVDARVLTDSPVSHVTPLYSVVENVSRGMHEDPVVVPSLTPGRTDLALLRRHGAQCYGWVPLVLTPELLATIHGHDERVPVEGFERAVVATTDVVTEVVMGVER